MADPQISKKRKLDEAHKKVINGRMSGRFSTLVAATTRYPNTIEGNAELFYDTLLNGYHFLNQEQTKRMRNLLLNLVTVTKSTNVRNEFQKGERFVIRDVDWEKLNKLPFTEEYKIQQALFRRMNAPSYKVVRDAINMHLDWLQGQKKQKDLENLSIANDKKAANQLPASKKLKAQRKSAIYELDNIMKQYHTLADAYPVNFINKALALNERPERHFYVDPSLVPEGQKSVEIRNDFSILNSPQIDIAMQESSMDKKHPGPKHDIWDADIGDVKFDLEDVVLTAEDIEEHKKQNAEINRLLLPKDNDPPEVKNLKDPIPGKPPTDTSQICEEIAEQIKKYDELIGEAETKITEIKGKSDPLIKERIKEIGGIIDKAKEAQADKILELKNDCGDKNKIPLLNLPPGLPPSDTIPILNAPPGLPAPPPGWVQAGAQPIILPPVGAPIIPSAPILLPKVTDTKIQMTRLPDGSFTVTQDSALKIGTELNQNILVRQIACAPTAAEGQLKGIKHIFGCL